MGLGDLGMSVSTGYYYVVGQVVPWGKSLRLLLILFLYESNNQVA